MVIRRNDARTKQLLWPDFAFLRDFSLVAEKLVKVLPIGP